MANAHAASSKSNGWKLTTVDVVPDRLGVELQQLGDLVDGQDEEAWPPPYKVVAPITGRVQTYHQGAMLQAEAALEALELEQAAAQDLHHIIHRIRAALPD